MFDGFSSITRFAKVGTGIIAKDTIYIVHTYMYASSIFFYLFFLCMCE